MSAADNKPDPSVLPASRVLDPAAAPPLRWGVLAPGWIARAFVGAAHRHTAQRVVAVGSRSAERAAAFASEFGIERSYGSYEELVGDAEVDVVYVASPHSEHLAQALLAIKVGKHVLVEKAFTRNAVEAEQLIEAASRHKVFLMEAMWARFLPHIDVVRQVLESGALGEIQSVTADHGQFMVPDASSRLFDPALAGGALLDLGIYPVSFASFVLGRFASTTAVGTKAFTGVDGQTSIVVTNGAGAHGLLGTTLFAKTPTTATISGTLARLELDGDFYQPTTMRLIARDGALLDQYSPGDLHGHTALRYEAAEVARCVAAGRLESELMPLAETLRVMQTMDQIRHQIGVSFPGE